MQVLDNGLFMIYEVHGGHALYIDTVPNRNFPPAVLLRESVRQGSRIRKRTLANLSHWTPARIEALRRALRGEFDHLSHPDPQLGDCFALLFALKQIADRTAITAALGKGRLAKLGLFLVLARVAQQVHDSTMVLEKVDRDFRTLKTGLLEVRPVWVRKESRTRGHVFCWLLALKLSREIERRLRAAFGTTGTGPQAITLPDALRVVTRLCLLHYQVDEKTTMTQLPQPDARQQEILQALGVTLPDM